ncbi:Diadenosine 5',5'''-P1,P4-tetraphosphate phosphorylase 2 [Balamuthia mandrillaris]
MLRRGGGAADGCDSAENSHRSSSLLDIVAQRSKKAKASGALHTIRSNEHILLEESTGIEHSIRVKKASETTERPQAFSSTIIQKDPFLPPYEEDLHILWPPLCPPGLTQGSYALLLNKFNVMDNHVLIVTTSFRPQVECPSAKDMTVLWRVVCELQGLGFYNCGKQAGPSQPHKHLQVVPYPQSERTPIVPFHKPIMQAAVAALSSKSSSSSTGATVNDDIEKAARNCVVADDEAHTRPFTVPQFKFKHSCCLLPWSISRATDWAALDADEEAENSYQDGKRLSALYYKLAAVLGLKLHKHRPTHLQHLPPDEADGEKREEEKGQSAVHKEKDMVKLEDISDPHNVLITKDWMLVVPRQQEEWEGISANGLNFSGSWYLKQPAQLELLKEMGAMNVLSRFAYQVS